MIKKVIVCDSCKKVILPTKGKIFQGNVYMIDEDVESRGGLIGNNFPIAGINPEPKDFKFTENDIKELHYCDECIVKILMLENIKGE